jgi:hypothetical protein
MAARRSLEDKATELDGMPYDFACPDASFHARQAAALARILSLAAAAMFDRADLEILSEDIDAIELAARSMEAHALRALAILEA